MVDKKSVVVIVLCSIVALILSQFLIFVSTGSIILDLEKSYSLNEMLTGNVGIIIEEGDLIPKDAEVLLNLNDKEISMAFEEFIDGQIDYIKIFEIIENCQRSVASEGGMNCVNETITNYFYNTPGIYSRNLEDLIDFTFTETGDYVLTLSIPSLDLVAERSFSIVEESVPESEVSISESSYSSSRFSSLDNNVRTISVAPTHINPILNSTDGSNATTQNLTCYNQSTSDGDLDSVKNIFNWYRNGTSIQVLNIPFESGDVIYDWVTGVVGNSLEFDGYDDYINLGDISKMNVEMGELTLSAWIRPRSFDKNSYIFVKDKDGLNRINFLLTSANNLQFSYNNNSISYAYFDYDAVALVNDWHHVVAVFNGSGTSNSDKVKIYFDGISQSLSYSGPVPSTLYNSTGYNADISLTTTNSFNGTIDEFMIFNRSLSSNEISDLYNNQSVGQTILMDDFNLIGYWSLNESLGYIAEDSAGSSDGELFGFRILKDYAFENNGTVNGAIWNATGGYDGKGAYEFSGSTNDIIRIPDSPSTSITGNITITAWFKANSLTDYSAIVKKRIGSSNSYQMNVLSSNNLIKCTIDTGDAKEAFSSTTVSLGQWHFGACTYDGSEINIYLDGVNGTPVAQNGSMVDTTDDLTIGSWYPYFEFNGSIDEVKIYNVVLSREQILALHNNRNDLIVSQETSIGDNWTCEITPNDGTTDGISLMSNNLTIVNSPPFHATVPLQEGYHNNITNGLIAEWRLEGNADDSANDNDGTLKNGPTLTTGKVGQAYDFDGVNDYITIGDDSDFEFGDTNFSIAAWFYTKGAAGYNSPGTIGIGTIISKYSVWNGTAGSRAFSMQQNASGNIGFYTNPTGTWYGGPDAHQNLFTDTFYSSNQWIFATVVYDGINKSIYVNGEFVKGDNSTGGAYDNGTAEVIIGALNFSNNFIDHRFNGTIDEVMVFNRSLSSEEIVSLYDRTDNRSRPILNSTLGTNLPTENLTCYVIGNDSEGDDLIYEGSWYKNDTLQFNFTTSNYPSGTLVAVDVLKSGNTSLGDEWYCEVRIFDGASYSGYEISPILTILAEKEEEIVEEKQTIISSGLPIYRPTSLELEKGYTKLLIKGGRIDFTFKDKDYSLHVDNFTKNSVIVFVDGVQELIVVGGSIKVDLEGDGEYYDLLIIVNSVNSLTNRADITIKYIEELIAEGEVPQTAEQMEEITSQEEKSLVPIIIASVIVVLIVSIFLIYSYLIKKK